MLFLAERFIMVPYANWHQKSDYLKNDEDYDLNAELNHEGHLCENLLL